MFLLIYGGSGSGKSEYAESLAEEYLLKFNACKKIYIATMMPFGKEAEKRIARHKKMREGKGFETIEHYSDLKNISIHKNSVVLIECMSNLVANEMFDKKNYNLVDDIMLGIEKVINNCKVLIVVTNDVFSDCIYYDEETVKYIKAFSNINKKLAECADIVTEVVCGIPLKIKG